MKTKQKIYIETYGCQMNVNDTEVALSVVSNFFEPTTDMEDADVLLVNTCSIRENAEQRIWGRLDVFRQIKKSNPEVKIGVIGCMAERLKEKFLENGTVDLVAGPDSYRHLHEIIQTSGNGRPSINVELSKEETYDNIIPVR